MFVICGLMVLDLLILIGLVFGSIDICGVGLIVVLWVFGAWLGLVFLILILC